MSVDSKKGQVTIFVIVALAIVGIILAIFLYPRTSIGAQVNENPVGYIKDCIEPVIDTQLGVVMAQGGFSKPEGYIMIDGIKVKYLCYTSEYYTTCINQVPMISKQVEKELTDVVQANMPACLSQMKMDYEKRGMSISIGQSSTNTTINTKGIKIDIQSPVTITKGENTQTFRNFDIIVPSKAYDLLMTATSIVEFETVYGDADTVMYMQYYPNLKIEKTLLSDGTTIYKLSDVTTEESFTFASRSVAWPAGYGAI